MQRIPFEAPDINLVEALAAQLIDANKKLEDANWSLIQSEHARIQMFANISHDLRAPLTAIRGALDRLLTNERADEQERRSMIEVIDRRVATLEHLISELYYCVSIEQPGFALRRKRIALAPFLEEWFIDRCLGEDCAQRDMRLDIPEGFMLAALIDPDYMVRVLDNLLGNALRFTGEGDQITLGCRCGSTAGGTEVYLRDTGCGIHPEDLPHIFERTYTASHSRTPDTKNGSGLGLHIAKTLVEKHGGSIRCESSAGHGCTFFIHLPEPNGDEDAC